MYERFENPCKAVFLNARHNPILTFSGSEAELYLFGGCVTSWKVANKDLLFVRPDAVFNGQKPIRLYLPL